MPKTDAEHIQQSVQKWIAENPAAVHVGATSECGCASLRAECVSPCCDSGATETIAMCALIVVLFMVGAFGVWLGRATAPKPEDSAKPDVVEVAVNA